MKKSIFLKIFGSFLFVILVLSGFILTFSFKAIKEYYIESNVNHLKNLGLTLQEQVMPLLEKRDTDKLIALAKRLGREIQTRITIIASDGVVLADSEENPEFMVNHRTRTEIAQAMEGNVGKFLRESETLKQQMLYVAVPVKKDARIIGVIRLSLFLKDINAMIGHTRKGILEISSLVIALSLLISFFFARSLSWPIKELSAVSKRIAHGDFSARVFLKSTDELKELADNFNIMASRMRTLFEELSGQKEQLDSVISSLQEGILVLDKDEGIALCNDSFRRITGNSILEGRPYWEYFRAPGFDKLIKNTRDKKANGSEEILFNGKTFLCSATFLSAKEEIAVIFLDITGIKNLEKIKTDFVSNISHELRTPLTAIRGFVETLEDRSSSDENRHYLEIISRNTDRLINIINDLLFLSELEEKSKKLELEWVDNKILLEGITKMFEQRLKEKKLSLHIDVETGMPPIKADPYKLEQMFINLIDNAVKYTEKGSIDISLKRKENMVEIVVEDTGIGIANEHLPRIFERFYVADKSRSKKTGGTGLGLSIVKHIVMLHDGTIDVKSSPGKGTEFIINLPL